ncbi:hypothetical protein L1274_005969, partial [Duganella sp. HSC-15S17]|nr:hypothetical protein [Duganella violaceicalia]
QEGELEEMDGDDAAEGDAVTAEAVSECQT